MTKKTAEAIVSDASTWWQTSLIDIEPGKIAIRGYPIQELIGRVRFPDMIWLMLRGDLPSGMVDAGEFRYANELVAFIRKETGDHFSLEVAAYPEVHPQARSARDDLLAFKRKVEAGANSAITQYFYNADAYFRFVDDCKALGLDVPIVPGIMPIASFSKLARFSDACGAEIPRWMRKKFEGYGDDADSIKAFGLDVVTDLCQRLLAGGAPGLHFYSMNMAGLTTEIVRRLGAF